MFRIKLLKIILESESCSTHACYRIVEGGAWEREARHGGTLLGTHIRCLSHVFWDLFPAPIACYIFILNSKCMALLIVPVLSPDIQAKSEQSSQTHE